jgi:ABC-type transporter Mla subunit MlaD
VSLKANYFKLGLFVVGAIIAGVIVIVVIGSGRWLQPRLAVETYFNESVQGLDVGSKLKYRGVVIGEVTRIGFTYNKYQQDRPMQQRSRYVLVEAQIQPKLLGGRAAGAGDLSDQKTADLEIERGLRMRLAPQGITGTSFLEIDYVDPPPAVIAIDWVPTSIYIPSAPSTVTTVVNAVIDILTRLHNLDIEGTLANLDTLLKTTTEKVAAVDTKSISGRADRVLAKMETSLDNLATKQLSDRGVALLNELRETNADLRKTIASPAFQKLPDDAAAALARVQAILNDPNVNASLAHLSQTLSRLDRIVGGGEADLTITFDNLRQITDNLRDLTEESKRYPANVIFGEPPKPPENIR